MTMKVLSKPLIIAVASTALAGGLGTYVWKEEHRPLILEMYVLALKSGRSMFVRTPEDKRILIDGGANSEVIRQITKILPFYSHRIHTVIATNTEGKNVSGLIDIVQRYKVDEVYLPAVTLESLGLASTTDEVYSTFLEKIKIENIKSENLSADRKIFLDSKTTLNVLFPADPDRFVYSKSSAPELLFNIAYGSKSILFLGNASNKVQKFVATSSEIINITADVLVVSHSALPANLALQLMKVIKPQYLIYSKSIVDQTAGKTSKSQPNSSTSSKKKVIPDPLQYLDNKKRSNLKEVGSIKIVTDGTVLKVVPWE